MGSHPLELMTSKDWIQRNPHPEDSRAYRAAWAAHFMKR